MAVVALVTDLLDRSKVTAVHPDARIVGAAAALPGAVQEGDLVVVDATRPGAVEVLAEVVAAVGPTGAVVAYGPHVETAVLAAAGAAGARAMPRSRFFADVAAATAR